MQQNVGGTDQTVRLLAGIAVLSVIVPFEGNWRWIGWVSLVPLTTSLVSWCPLYQLAGINTGRKEAKHV